MNLKNSKQYGLLLPGRMALSRAYDILAEKLAREENVSLAIRSSINVSYRTDETGITPEMIKEGWPDGWTSIKVTYEA